MMRKEDLPILRTRLQAQGHYLFRRPEYPVTSQVRMSTSAASATRLGAKERIGSALERVRLANGKIPNRRCEFAIRLWEGVCALGCGRGAWRWGDIEHLFFRSASFIFFILFVSADIFYSGCVSPLFFLGAAQRPGPAWQVVVHSSVEGRKKRKPPLAGTCPSALPASRRYTPQRDKDTHCADSHTHSCLPPPCHLPSPNYICVDNPSDFLVWSIAPAKTLRLIDRYKISRSPPSQFESRNLQHQSSIINTLHHY